VSKELPTELRHKKEAYKEWKQGQVTQEKYRVAVCSCSDSTRKAEADLELNLATFLDVKGNKKGFYK